MRRVRFAALVAPSLVLVALVGCKKPAPPGIADAAPAASAAEVDAYANLPWATEINMDASTTASASATPAPAPAPAPAASVAVFTGPTGTFSGRVKDSGDVYTVTANVGPSGGTVTYGPPLNCSGSWKLTSNNPTTTRYVEKITNDPGKKCTPVVDVTLEREASKPGAYWYSAGAGQARALITKQ